MHVIAIKHLCVIMGYIVVDAGIGKKTKDLPILTRRKRISDIFTEYTKYCVENGSDRIGRKLFKKMLRILATRDEKMISSVDYVTGTLANDTCSLLQQIIDKLITGVDRQVLTTDPTNVRYFQKIGTVIMQ
jgi:hypothetical protein